MVARVLLIDGDDLTRTRYAAYLRSMGCDVTAVPDGHGATLLALASGAQLVVTDASPRGAIDGVEVTRRLRHDDRTRGIRVVLLAALGDEDTKAEARAVGCDVVLDRHCDPALLASEIKQLVVEGVGERVDRRARTRH